MPSELDEFGPADIASSSDELMSGSDLDQQHTAGASAFAYHDRDAEIAGLAFDSVVDTPSGEYDDVRRLRFVGSDCVIDVEVFGFRRRTVEVVDVSAAGSAVVATVSVHAICTGEPTVWAPGHTLPPQRLALTSFVVRWTDPHRRTVRTAWIAM